MKKKFNWDQGNLKKIDKNNRDISLTEIESVFSDPFAIHTDDKYVDGEQRYLANGMSNQGRLISVIYVYRKDKIRPITAWPTSKGKKRKVYYEQFR